MATIGNYSADLIANGLTRMHQYFYITTTARLTKIVCLMTNDQALTIAAQALRFLAGDPERLTRFCSMTGLEPESIANCAGEAAFLSGVLGHLLTDEAMVLEFCETMSLPPQSPARAQAALSGEIG